MSCRCSGANADEDLARRQPRQAKTSVQFGNKSYTPELHWWDVKISFRSSRLKSHTPTLVALAVRS